jgi:hypothetical protein
MAWWGRIQRFSQRDRTTAALRSTAPNIASGFRHDDPLNVGTPRAEWYASSHSLGSEHLREWYTSRVHVALQQYAIRSMPSGISAPTREVAHASTEFRRFWGMSGTPPAYISDGRVRNSGRPSVGLRSRPALRLGREKAAACGPCHLHARVDPLCGYRRVAARPRCARDGSLAAPTLWRCARGGRPC